MRSSQQQLLSPAEVEWSAQPPRRSTSSLQSDPSIDRGLLSRMAEGDDKALASLYDRWAPRIYSVALLLLQDEADAEEVLVEAFWQAWRDAGRYDWKRGSVGTWLSLIARSRALDRRRSPHRSRVDSWNGMVPGWSAAMPTSKADPLADAEGRERSGLVRRAVGRLPDEQRETVELAFFRGLSHSEIASHTGQPLGTIKTRLRLAMSKLKIELAILRDATG